MNGSPELRSVGTLYDPSADPDPVVGVQHVLSRIDPRHMAFDATVAWRHPARRTFATSLFGRLVSFTGRRLGPTAATVTGQTDRFVRRTVGRRACVRVVAGHAIEATITLFEAPGLHDPDRLEPS